MNAGLQVIVRENGSNDPLKSNYYDPLSDLIKVYKNTESKTSSDYYKITEVGNRIIFNFKNIELFLECHGNAKFSSCFNSEKDKIIIILDNNKEHISSLHGLAKAINQLKNVRQISLTSIQFKNWPTEYRLDKLAENVEIDDIMLAMRIFWCKTNLSRKSDKKALLNVFKKITIALRGNQKDLDLSNMNLWTLPEELSSFCGSFETIRLNKNYFSAIPSCFTQLSNLKTLYIDNNPLFEKNFDEQLNIPQVILDLNQIEEMSEIVQKNSNFMVLIFDHIYYLSEIFPFIKWYLEEKRKDNPRIRILSIMLKSTRENALLLGNLGLDSIPECFYSYKLENILRIYLNNNKLKEVPEAIFNDLKNLILLDLSGNIIAKLPSTINSLLSITNLNLANNQLKEIPEKLRDLSTLKNLDLSKNPIEKLEDDSLPTNIEELNISETKITRLPLSFTNRSIVVDLDECMTWNFGQNPALYLRIVAVKTEIPTDWKNKNQDEIRRLKTKSSITIAHIDKRDQMNDGNKKVLKKRPLDQEVTRKQKKPKFD